MSNTCSSACNIWRKGIVFAAAIALGGWAVMTVLDRRNTPPEVETVEISVAAQDLPVGTTIAPEDVATCVTRASVPKDSMPDTAVVDGAEFHDKRLARSLRKGEAFNRQDLLRGCAIRLAKGKEWVTVLMQYPPHDYWLINSGWSGWSLELGGWLHVSTMIQRDNKLEPVILTRDVLVVAMNSTNVGTSVSLAVDPQTKELIELAQARGCEFLVMRSEPQHPFDSEPVDVARVKQLLENLPVKTPAEP